MDAKEVRIPEGRKIKELKQDWWNGTTAICEDGSVWMLRQLKTPMCWERIN